MKKITFVKYLPFLITLFCAVNFGFGQIVAWEMDPVSGSNTGDEVTVNATTLAGGLNMSTLRRGNGIEPSALLRAFSSNNFTLNGMQSDAISNNDYIQFEVSASSGYQVSLSTLDANFRRSSTGPKSFIWKYSTDGTTFTDIGTVVFYDVNPTNGTAQAQINLSGIPALQNVVSGTTITFRLYGWDSTSINGSGSFAIGRLSGNDLSIGGVVVSALPCPSPTVTWNGTSWTPSAPTSTSPAIINGDYDTATYGSFSACSLTVNAGFTLAINDVDNGALSNTYVEIANDVTINGTILMNAKANFVQLNDSGSVNGTGTAQVEKNTAPMNAWYEYTYWSSPVFEPQIEVALTDSEPSRRFEFYGQNYLDATAETNNNGATDPWQDGIDDNNDAWQWVSGTTLMEPGKGYAATISEFAYNTPPVVPNKRFKSTFIGLFNYGVIGVSIYRNDSERNDDNWNLIGNPYPSAISADEFFLENAYVDVANASVSFPVNTAGTIDGAIYLWSQNTPPSSTANGNQAYNFSSSDYAVINLSGETQGGDDINEDGVVDILDKPNRFIPSGQGFFVSMSNDATATPITVPDYTKVFTSTVTFNNAMRVNGATDNSQFFKNTNTKGKSTTSAANKIWVNLTSDNGVFGQILVAYVDGATNGNDGLSYDAPKFSTDNASVLYTTIENSNKKFAIQGKAINSINKDEIINLGFNTSIDVPTLYTLSIAQLQGDFLTAHTIYLKDNLTNTLHDLSASDYTFTSEVGEFNERFQIVFNAVSLSTDTFDLNANTVNILQVDDTHVSFRASNNQSIKTVTIYDLLGRQLYQLKGQNSEETYNLSKLNHAIFIAKIELSNGAFITKKAIKK